MGDGDPEPAGEAPVEVLAGTGEEPDEPEPKPVDPTGFDHYELYERVKDSLFALPRHFDTAIYVEGIKAGDVPKAGELLGAGVEEKLVEALNKMDPVWDPHDEYADCSFVRQAQKFPDVVLMRHTASGDEPIMGIELKAWYLLAKEKEPNFRYKADQRACAPQDLAALVPWSLSNVVSGEPILHRPWVMPAKTAAEWVDYYWQEERDTESDTTINRPDDPEPYPGKADRIAKEAEVDSGNNYGRLARSGAMKPYLKERLLEELCGVPAEDWIGFFKDNA